jgi:ceramide glucosyltransferase
VLLPYAIETVPDYQSFRELFIKRLRWMTVMRNMRPAGHAGLIFTLGLPWTLVAMAVAPTTAVAGTYLGAYLAVRWLLTLLVGTVGLKQRGVWGNLLLVPVWDALATCIWLASFTRRSIRWRGHDYRIVDGNLVPVRPEEVAQAMAAEAVRQAAMQARKSPGEL